MSEHVEFCRLCLCGDQKLKSLTDEPSQEKLNKIYELSGIEIKLDSGLPNGICQNCIRLLEISWKFRNQIKESHRFILENFTTVEILSTGVDLADDFDIEIIASEYDNEDEHVPKEETEREEHNSEEPTNDCLEEQSEEDDEHDDTLSNEKEATTSDLTCKICGKQFRLSSSLVIHNRTHTGERPYKCDVCDKTFTLSGNLHVHQKVHTNEREFQCPICKKHFKHNGTLNEHLRTHSDVRQFQCNVCDYQTNKKSSLNTHIRTHTGERPYVCKEKDCGKGFSNLSNFYAHVRIHKDEKPYACRGCGKGFTQISARKRHEIQNCKMIKEI